MPTSQRSPRRALLGRCETSAERGRQRACAARQKRDEKRPPSKAAPDVQLAPDAGPEPDLARFGCLGVAFRPQFGLPRGLFLGILSTSSGSARSISSRAIRSINVAVVKPRRSASCAAVSTFRAKPSRLPGYVIPVPHRRCEMKDPTFVAELQKRLGAPSSETVESLRLLKAFLKLAPGQRFEVIELVERLAAEPAGSDPSLS